MNEDLRICFIGDSFVQGIGDPEYRGWVGRVLTATDPGITAFNLGIRRNTSTDVLRRCWREVEPRVLPGSGGYQRLAELILDGRWHSWIARPTP